MYPHILITPMRAYYTQTFTHVFTHIYSLTHQPQTTHAHREEQRDKRERTHT